MKTLLRSTLTLAKEGKKTEAEKLLPSVFKSIDLAAKKGVIHWKNAARKKSLVCRALVAKK
jgi:small subunit ribosomal protein S20